MKEAEDQTDKTGTILVKGRILQEKVYTSQREYNQNKKGGRHQKQRFELQEYMALESIKRTREHLLRLMYYSRKLKKSRLE